MIALGLSGLTVLRVTYTAVLSASSRHKRRAGMTRKSTSKPFSLNDVKARITKGESQSRADAPEAEDDLPAAFWTDGVRVTRRPAKQSIHLRVDADVLAWFKSQGAGHLTLMNEVLRAYAAAKARKVG